LKLQTSVSRACREKDMSGQSITPTSKKASRETKKGRILRMRPREEGNNDMEKEIGEETVGN